jgi:hypothetical protein
MPEGLKDRSYESWRRALGGKFDRRSVVADPRFYDVEKRDFRLRPGSHAHAVGFSPIDVSEIGLRGDFPARFERE